MPLQEPWLYDMHPVSNYETVLRNSTCDSSKYTEMSWYVWPHLYHYTTPSQPFSFIHLSHCRHDVLRCLNEREGVLAEALFQTYFGALPSMISSTKVIHSRPGAKYVRTATKQ